MKIQKDNLIITMDLKKVEISIESELEDAELDILQCKYNYDGCVEINTEEMKYISLSQQNLIDLLETIQKADKEYEQFYENNKETLEKLENKNAIND